MARIEFTVPDAAVPRIAAAFGWRGVEQDGSVGLFIKARLAEIIRDRVGWHEGQIAADVARRDAHQRSVAEIPIT